MANEAVNAYALAITKQRIASICLALGWNSANTSTLEVLQDLMVRYIRKIGVTMKDNAEFCNRSQPNLHDLLKAFTDMNVHMDDLVEYAEQFDCRALVTDPVPKFPAPAETRLNFLKPGSREVLHRPVYVHEHLPPMHPELEAEADDCLTAKEPAEASMAEVKKEPDEGSGDVHHPIRDLASVMMTSAGFISPAREGRMAESRTPASEPPSLVEDDQPSRTKPIAPSSKPVAKIDDDDTSDEGVVDNKEVVAEKKSAGQPKLPQVAAAAEKKAAKKTPTAGSKLSVFQRKKAAAPADASVKTSPKVKKAEKRAAAAAAKAATAAARAATAAAKAASTPAGRGRGRKKKIEVNPTSKAFISDDDDESSPERPPAAKKPRMLESAGPAAKPEPAAPVVSDVPPVLPDNPLIPKYFGFGNMLAGDGDEAKKELEEGEIEDDSSPPKKKDKKDKKAKKDKREKKDKKEKAKDKKKRKQPRPASPPLFAVEKKPAPVKPKPPPERPAPPPEKPPPKPSPAPVPPLPAAASPMPKIKMKDIGEADPSSGPASGKSSPKLVIKNVGAAEKAKVVPPREPDIFSDPVHIERPRSSASDHGPESKKAVHGEKKRPRRPEATTPKPAKARPEPSEKPAVSSSSVASSSSGSVVTQTVGYYVDSEGNQIWICPACGKQDDGSPMIGCDDKCDDWYHWLCVGIQQEPPDNQDWFCPRCVAKRSGLYLESSSGSGSAKKAANKRGGPPKAVR